MGQRPINGRWTRSVVGSHLIGCGVGIPGGLLGGTPSKKIEGHDPACGSEPGKQSVVKMQIVWKAMHQDDGRLLAWILTRVDVIGTALDDMFRVRYGLLLEHKFLLISCLCTYYHNKLD